MRGPAVALVQGALAQLGPGASGLAKATGAPDGVFGPETLKRVMAFQVQAKLKPDGIVGRATLLALDAVLAKQTKPTPASPAVKVPLPSSPHYEIGAGDPPNGADRGAGVWRSKKPEATYLALKQAIVEVLPMATVTVGFDAAKHMYHYLGNSGKDCWIDLEGMVRHVPSARERYEREVAQAMDFVERLSTGNHSIRSRVGEFAYNLQSENRNWYFAIGGYTSWGQGVAAVRDTPGGRDYELEFEYKLFDRYNWDAGKFVTIAGVKVTDAFMGEFHRQGLAREFNCYGAFKRRFSWKKGSSILPQQLHPMGGR